MQKYVSQPSLRCQQASDYKFACEHLLKAAKDAYLGWGDRLALEEARAIFVSVAFEEPFDGYPDSERSGLNARDLKHAFDKASIWYRLLSDVLAGYPDLNIRTPTALQACIHMELDYQEFRKSEAPALELEVADPLYFEFN